MILVATDCYSEKENENLLKFHMSNCSYFETRVALY